jgi:phosphoribosyl-ATP pyrophosphohydrolase
MDTLSRLETTIAQRRTSSAQDSYVAGLFAWGLPTMVRKMGEEAIEATVAALAGERNELVGEAADLLFHLMVVLAARDVSLGDVLAELERREGTSGLAEKAARSAP